MQALGGGGSRATAVAGLTATGFLLSRALSSSHASERGPIAATRHHRVAFGAVEGENRGGGSGSLAPFAKAIQRDDPWFWLRDDDRKDPAILAHLEAENAHAQHAVAHLEGLRKELYDEHLSHVKETDEQPPTIHGDYFYYTRTVKGQSYKIHCRKPRGASPDARLPAPDAAEEVLLDENAVAEGRSHCDIHSVKPSPDHSLLAYTVDFEGNEIYVRAPPHPAPLGWLALPWCRSSPGAPAAPLYRRVPS